MDCRRHKRNTASALAFEGDRERQLVRLHRELVDDSYRPGRSICSVVTRPKPREVWAADFRDRIVHHLLYNRIADRFHARFIADSCACIPGRGTLYAASRLAQHVRSATENWQYHAHYLKCDLANFFVAIDKVVLRGELHRHIEPGWWRDLADLILLHDPRSDVLMHSPQALMRVVPPHKSLFNAPAHCGLPIGNLSSQFFANVYLNALDQHVKHDLRIKHYVRYVDDFVLIHRDPAVLRQAHDDIGLWLPATLHASLNPRKTIIQPVSRGIDFVGNVIKPWSQTTRRRSVRAALRRIEAAPAEELGTLGNSYFGLLRQAPKSHMDRVRLANALRKRGKAIVADLTKTVGVSQ
ncbi:RNA-directed DNA polymerase [Roseateles sp. UC29_93]|uniref:RNA-directed DNA polymerase n=1 Tax=Roseateles sp. UC29_93 TaxID=3350177 RepID=UPI00366E5327